MGYAPEGHTVHRVIYHVIWCPTRRRNVLVGLVRDRVARIMRAVATEQEWKVIPLALQPDHVPLCSRANPTTTLPSDSARRIKGRRAHLMREEFPHLLKLPSLWTRSCLLSTAGNLSQESIQRSSARHSKP